MSKPDVVMIGLGYIGLPTAALIASKKINVLGVDINENVVEIINKGKIHIVEPDLDLAVANAVNHGFLKASIVPKEANTYIIVVPTPFKKGNIPDISYIEAATLSIVPLLKKGDLYIIESTSPIGTTEKMMNCIFSVRPELKDEMFFAYCPERVLPGNVMYELVNNDRVIGGVNDESTQKAIEFYAMFVKGELHASNSRTAEMCKLVENSSRDVQIAFANELSMICDKAKINVRELIELANKHPRVNILQPACGVGGHCIAVDPYFIVSDFPHESKIISKAREVNNFKPQWCVEKIKNAQLEFKHRNKVEPTIAILGLAFKPNIDDLRESPALYIAKEIYKESKKCMIVEPNICDHDFFDLTDLSVAISLSDIIVVLVKHNEFKSLIINENKILIDFCGI